MNTPFVLIFAVLFCAVVRSKPLEYTDVETSFEPVFKHKLAKRFINPSMTSGDFSGQDFSKIRAKRDVEDECEKLRLCKLHAQSNRSFFAAFELYFVNKENARLWDHRARSSAECDQRYSCYK